MLETVTTGMARAGANGEALWREPADMPAGPMRPPAAAFSDRSGRVVIMADASCGSACLDALDLWKRLGALQVGVETSADSVYMDIGPRPLPSELSRISVPMKACRVRGRGSNQRLVPDRRYGGDMRDTAALEAWVPGIEATTGGGSLLPPTPH